MKQVEVQIMGNSYILGCPEGGEPRLMQAVHKVDAAMSKIRDGGKIKARDRIAVLAALNMAFDLGNPDQNPSDTHEMQSVTLDRRESDKVLQPLIHRLDKFLADDGKLV